MNDSSVEVLFLVSNTVLAVVAAVLWRLRRIQPPIALCLILICTSGILGPVAILLGLPRGLDSVIGVTRIGVLIGAWGALGWFAWTSSDRLHRPHRQGDP